MRQLGLYLRTYKIGFYQSIKTSLSPERLVFLYLILFQAFIGLVQK